MIKIAKSERRNALRQPFEVPLSWAVMLILALLLLGGRLAQLA